MQLFRNIAPLVLGTLVVLAGSRATAQQLPAIDPADLHGTVFESTGVDRATAEQILTSAEAAVYFPRLHQLRWLARDESASSASATRRESSESVATFRAQLDRDFPEFDTSRYGPYLMKMPDRTLPLASEALYGVATSTALADGFENGLSQWQLANNAAGDYNFTVMGCQVHSGSWSADAFRGGTKGQYLTCFDTYPSSLTTQMNHASCEAMQGASEAWLDFYLAAQMDVSGAVGAYYLGSDGYLYGYTFTGSWSGWYHIVLNLRQWPSIGDVTALSCPRVFIQFRSDAAASSGAGPAIDDLTIRTGPPSSLRCSINATPSSGSAPLTVNFTPTVSGASGSETYEWRFGDAAGSTSTSRSPSFTYATGGQYWPRVRVSDANNTRAYAYTRIQVGASSSCSVSCSATVPSSSNAGTSVAFQSIGTATGCSGSPSYLWSFGDGQTSSQQNTTHAYAAAGTFTWALTVAAGGSSCTKSGTISIAAKSASRRRSVGISPGPQAISISISGTTATVTQSGTLKGASWTFPQSPPAGLSVSSVAAANAPTIPPGITRLSDFFTVTPVSGKDLITFAMPSSLVPAGRSAKDLRLYVYTSSASDASYGGGFDKSFWVRTWYNLDVLPNANAVVKLTGLGETSFIGVEAPVTPPAASFSLSTHAGAEAVSYNCNAKTLANGTTDGNQQVCAITYDTGKSFTATIKNIGDLHLTPAASLGDLVGWLAAGRKAFDGYGMQSDPTFEVDVGPMPAEAPTALGFVTTRNLEDRRVLHITNAAQAKDLIQGTVVHEYFHHAQARTSSAGLTNMLDLGRRALWLTEGLARWVEDDIFDSLDTYALKEASPLPRLLNVGLAAADDSANDSSTRSYARFAFWKLVQSSCSGFSVPQLMNIDTAADPNGMANTKSRFESAVWQCDFGSGLGDGNRQSLATALLAYAFATIKNDDISLLDSNERDFSFVGTSGLPEMRPSSDCTPSSQCAGSRLSGSVAPAGVGAFLVDAVASPPEGKVATLWLETDPAQSGLFLWVGDNERLISSAAEGKWGTAGQTGVQYGDASRAPQALVLIVNPSAASSVGADVRAGFASKSDKLPWSFQTQWNDEILKTSAVWSSTGNGVVEAAKGMTVTVDTSLPNLPKLVIRGHGATGPVVVSGSYAVKIQPMSGRYNFSDGTYAEFTFSNPQFLLDRWGTAAGSDFRYEIPAESMQAGLVQSWRFDLKIACFKADGTRYSCGWEGITGAGSGMIIDFERDQ